MPEQRIDDDEIVYRRVPPTSPWMEEEDRVTTANFKLNRKRGELGLSVYRSRIISMEDVLQHEDAIRGSRIAQAMVRDIRNLKNKADEPLLLDVVAVDDEDNPGHAEIRGPDPGTLTRAASRALQELFELI